MTEKQYNKLLRILKGYYIAIDKQEEFTSFREILRNDYRKVNMLNKCHDIIGNITSDINRNVGKIYELPDYEYYMVKGILEYYKVLNDNLYSTSIWYNEALKRIKLIEE